MRRHRPRSLPADVIHIHFTIQEIQRGNPLTPRRYTALDLVGLRESTTVIVGLGDR